MSRSAAAVVAIVMGLTGTAGTAARDWTVGGSCGSTIQDCIDFASPGDRVLIPAGTWSESLTLAKAVSLGGAGTTLTTVQPPRPGLRVLTVTGSAVDENVRIERLTVANGDVSDDNVCYIDDLSNCGGGILIAERAQPELRNLIIRDCRAYRGGGLYISEQSYLSLFNVSFLRNASVLTGGGIYSREGLTVQSGNFEDNVSELNVGGGLYVSGPDQPTSNLSTVIGSAFRRNIANSLGTGSISRAGAVGVFGADLTITDSLFEDNRCIGDTCDGGAVNHLASFNPIVLTIENSDFVDNDATRLGGGVYLSGPSQLQLTGGSFAGNTAATGAGVYTTTGGSIDGTRFTGNVATLGGFSFNDGDGGGAFMRTCPTSLTNAVFENNQAVNGGGFGCFLGPLTVTDAQFTGNQAGEDGGGLWVEVGGALLLGGSFSSNSTTGEEGDGGGAWVQNGAEVDGTSFVGNTAARNGGGLHVEQGDVLLTGGSFSGNVSQAPATFFSEGGAGLYVRVGGLEAVGTTFQSNTAEGGIGGGAYVNGPTDLSAVLFDDNQAERGGGGLLGRGMLTLTNGSVFTDNRAVDGNGGGALILDHPAQVAGGEFRGNVAGTTEGAFGGGGGLYVDGAVTLDGVQFVDNTSSTGGGGGLSASDGGEVTDCTFFGNQTAGAGGGMRTFNDPLTIRTSTFELNTASSLGGGFGTSFSQLTLEGSTFVNNRSIAGSGGAIGSSSFVNADASTVIRDNVAQVDGGGIYANSGATLTGTVLEDNEAVTGVGGGLGAPLGLVRLFGAVLRNNRANEGGGAYFYDATDVRDTTFETNVATGAGGGLYLRRYGTIQTSRFTGNQAGSSGGGLHKQGPTGTTRLEIRTSTFDGNSAGTSGGGINNVTRGIDLTNVTLGQNTAPIGSALYLDGGDIFNLVNLTVVEPANPTAGAVTGLNGSQLSWSNSMVVGDCLYLDGADPTSLGGNVEAVTDTCELIDATDRVGVAVATLGLDASLLDNGGMTPTYALLPGSMAIDTGVAPCPAVDQRGALRFDGACDVGAFEDAPLAVDLVFPDRDMLAWNDLAQTVSFDVIRGDLQLLRAAAGDFSTTTEECVADDHPTADVAYPAEPLRGEGYWFLVRPVTVDANGSYDSGGDAQVAFRDGGVTASGFDCP